MLQATKLALTLLLVLVIGALAWLVEYLTDRFRPDISPFARFIVLLLLALAVGFAALQLANAHDHNHPERNAWLKSLHAKNNTWCCDGNDHDALDDWETSAGGYRVKFRGQWFDVPDDSIIEGPNKTGEALLWMNKGFSGPSVRCFMPGTMS